MHHLPNELKQSICLFLDNQSLGRLACTSKEWQCIAEDEFLWRERLAAQSSYTHPDKTPKSILKAIEAFAQLSIDDLVKIARSSLEEAKIILHTPSLAEKFDNCYLTDLAQSKLTLAKIILQTPSLASQLDNAQLTTIAKSDVESAKLVFQDPALASKLDKLHLIMIAKSDPRSAAIIYKNPSLIAKLELGEISPPASFRPSI